MMREIDKLRKNHEISHQKFSDISTLLDEHTTSIDAKLECIQQEYHRVYEISSSAERYLDEIDNDFKNKVKLNDVDIKLLFLCTGIQCVRQYILSNDKIRISASDGDRIVQKAFSNSIGKVAPPTIEEILFQSVPYDTISTSEHVSDTGLSGLTHRYRTLGHDPILGWIFGTANILTNSLTRTDFISFQVKNNTIIRRYPKGTGGMLNNAISYATDDPKLLAVSVVRQAIHFGSDYFTKQGLPVPIIATVNNDLAKTMILKGNIDLWSITRGASVAVLINKIIAMIHQLFYCEEVDGNPTLYEMRTRKIITLSNALATGSNTIVVTLTKDLRKLDVGGMLVTIHRLINDYKFIQAVKKDYLKNATFDLIEGKSYDFMEE